MQTFLHRPVLEFLFCTFLQWRQNATGNQVVRRSQRHSNVVEWQTAYVFLFLRCLSLADRKSKRNFRSYGACFITPLTRRYHLRTRARHFFRQCLRGDCSCSVGCWIMGYTLFERSLLKYCILPWCSFMCFENSYKNWGAKIFVFTDIAHGLSVYWRNCRT